MSRPIKRFKPARQDRPHLETDAKDTGPPAAVLPPVPAASVPRVPTSELIFQMMVDLTNSSRIVSRQVLVEQTGLNYSIVDDHVKRMIDDGRVRRVVNGIFEPVLDTPEDRAVSVTYLPGGCVKLEIGDHLIELTMRETREIGMATAGVSLQFGR